MIPQLQEAILDANIGKTVVYGWEKAAEWINSLPYYNRKPLGSKVTEAIVNSPGVKDYIEWQQAGAENMQRVYDKNEASGDPIRLAANRFTDVSNAITDTGYAALGAPLNIAAKALNVDRNMLALGMMIAGKGSRFPRGGGPLKPVQIKEILPKALPPGRQLALPGGGNVSQNILQSKTGGIGRYRKPSQQQTALAKHVKSAKQDPLYSTLSDGEKLKLSLMSILTDQGDVSPRASLSIAQMSQDSKLLEELSNATTVDEIVRIQKNFFARHPQYGAIPGNELDHLNPVGRVGQILIGQRPAVVEEALIRMQQDHGIVFSDEGEMSSLPHFAHSEKHSGDPNRIDWNSPWAQEIIEKVPKNATAKELEASLLELHNKSLVMTGRAVQTQNFQNFRDMLMDILPTEVRSQLGENFDITGRTTPKKDWDLFRLSIGQSPLKTLIREESRAMPNAVADENTLLDNLFK